MGGVYGKLLIAAYIAFITVMLCLIVLGIVVGKRGDKTSSPDKSF